MNFIACLLSYSYMYYNALSIYVFFIDNLSIVHIRILFIWLITKAKGRKLLYEVSPLE